MEGSGGGARAEARHDDDGACRGPRYVVCDSVCGYGQVWDQAEPLPRTEGDARAFPHAVDRGAHGGLAGKPGLPGLDAQRAPKPVHRYVSDEVGSARTLAASTRT